MEGWSGFTDEELRKLKKPPSRLDYNPGQENVKVRPTAPRTMTDNGRPMGRAGIRPSGPIQGRPPRKEGKSALSPDMMLSQPKLPVRPEIAKEQSPTNSSSQQSTEPVKKSIEESEKTPSGNDSPEKTEHIGEIEVKEVSEKAFLQKQLSKVESYQLQQKVMEQQNKLKKKFLSEAIAEKQKRAKAEASKLQHIQKELAALDQMLSSDVAIIRNRIEEASREFLEAQKRYEIAEKEFVESKIALHHANHEKEQLTEHLYTIIHQNEIRKAKKLTELMEKLELAEDVDVPDVKIELTNLMPNLVPEMSTISSFELLNRKRSHRETSVSLSGDENEKHLNGSSEMTSDTGAVEVNKIEVDDASSVAKKSQEQAVTSAVASGTDASGQVSVNVKGPPSQDLAAESSASETNSVTPSQKDQNDNVKSQENLT